MTRLRTRKHKKKPEIGPPGGPGSPSLAESLRRAAARADDQRVREWLLALAVDDGADDGGKVRLTQLSQPQPADAA